MSTAEQAVLSPRLKNAGADIMEGSKVKMQLVPCRWQKSGWKYVEVDPRETRFFASPNRVNSTGTMPKADSKLPFTGKQT